MKTAAGPRKRLGECCDGAVMAYFPGESRPVKLLLRHDGPHCLGQYDKLSFGAWYTQGQVKIIAQAVAGPEADG